MVDLIDIKGDKYISPELEKFNRAMNNNSLGKVGKVKKMMKGTVGITEISFLKKFKKEFGLENFMFLFIKIKGGYCIKNLIIPTKEGEVDKELLEKAAAETASRYKAKNQVLI